MFLWPVRRAIQPGNMRPMQAARYHCCTFCCRTCTVPDVSVLHKPAEQSLIGSHDSVHLIPPSSPLSPCFSFLPTVSSAPSLYTPQPEAFLFYFHIILLTDGEGPPTLFMQSKWPLLLLNAVHKKSCYNISG